MTQSPNTPDSEVSTLGLTRRSLVVGGTALVLSGCNPTQTQPMSRKSALHALGVTEFPAIVYLSYDGCAPEAQPHNYKTINAVLDAVKVKTYVLDVDSAYLPSDRKSISYQDVDKMHLPFKERLTIAPGEYRSMSTREQNIDKSVGKAAEMLKSIGFRVNSNDLRSHSGSLLLINDNLEVIGDKNSKIVPAKIIIEEFTQALHSRQHSTNTRGR